MLKQLTCFSIILLYSSFSFSIEKLNISISEDQLIKNQEKIKIIIKLPQNRKVSDLSYSLTPWNEDSLKEEYNGVKFFSKNNSEVYFYLNKNDFYNEGPYLLDVELSSYTDNQLENSDNAGRFKIDYVHLKLRPNN